MTKTGVLVVFAVPHDEHHAGTLGYAQRFLHLMLETSPALLIGYALAGALKVALPRASLGWVSRGGSLSQAVRGMAFGIPIPICSCGVVPVYQGLVKRGVPAAAGMAFLVATPELGIESLLLSIPLLGRTSRREMSSQLLISASGTPRETSRIASKLRLSSWVDPDCVGG